MTAKESVVRKAAAPDDATEATLSAILPMVAN